MTEARGDYGNCPEMDQRRAWNVGREAREHKATLDDNPFWPVSLRAAWAAGWHGTRLGVPNRDRLEREKLARDLGEALGA